jgi:Spy/CpxP family protein refolding chaperone
MKRLALVFTVVIAAAAFAFPAYAMGGGMGGGMSGGMGGSGMMGNSGSGLLDWFQNWRNGSQYNHPPGQERKEIGELDQQHDEDSAYLKYQIQMKEKELDGLLDSPKPDLEKVRQLRKGIRELRAEADQEQRSYELETGKMNPGYRSGNSNGWSSYGSPGRSGSGGTGYGGGGGGMGNGGRMGGY